MQQIEKNNLSVKESDLEGKYLTFWTDGQLFGISIANVVQIVQMQPITAIPEFPLYAKGIIHLRGSIIPIIDVRLRFGKTEKTHDDHTCIIITNIQNQLKGFIVDSVEEVADIPEQGISPPPSVSDDIINNYLMGVVRHSDRIILLLDIQKILGEEFD